MLPERAVTERLITVRRGGRLRYLPAPPALRAVLDELHDRSGAARALALAPPGGSVSETKIKALSANLAERASRSAPSS